MHWTKKKKILNTFMGDIVSSHVVPVHLQILIGTCGPSLDVEDHLLGVTHKHIVVKDSFHCCGRPTASRANEQATDVVGHIVVVEEDVTGVLDVEEDG